MSAVLNRPAPGSIRVLSRGHGSACKTWLLDKSAEQYSDDALLSYCDSNTCFGGHVDRRADGVLVTVYTD